MLTRRSANCRLSVNALCTTGLLALALVILAGSPCAMAARQEAAVAVGGAVSQYEVTYRAQVRISDIRVGDHMGYDTVALEAAGRLKEPGLPALPAWTAYIAIPAGMEVTGLREVRASTVAIPGTFDILPAQFPRAITGEPLAEEAIPPDPAIYSSAESFPAERVEFIRQSDLAGQNLAAIRVCPFVYRPATGELNLVTEIEVVLEGRAGHTCGDYLAPGASRRSRDGYLRTLKDMVVNPQDVHLAQAFSGPVLRGVSPGEYGYVIVTKEVWVDDFEPLAEWRTKQGYKVNTVTTEWIYTSGGYTGTELEKMRSFIIDAHSNWGTTHFVLGGDTDLIPFHTRAITVPGWQTDYLDNDVYYADYDEDWILEVNLGRLSVRTVGHIANAIGKIFTYEKNPPLTSYVKTAFFIGMDITVCGDMDGEIFKENYIRAGHLPGTWSLDTEYDGEAGTHLADILAYLDSGYHLVNHHDHCNADCMGAGWICHSDLFYNADIDALTNGDRLSIFFAVGCYPAHFPTIRCIAESALRTPGGGGVAFMGNTATGWGGDASNPDLYSLRQDRFFYRNLFDLGIYNLGENFTRLKNDEYDPDDPYNLHRYAFTNLHLIGDPGLTIWTDDPQALSVTHPTDIPSGAPTTFDVEVSGGGGPLDGASVCLYKDGDIHEVLETSGGEASFNITPAAEGTLYVTVCCHNYIPYEGSCAVDASAGAEGVERRRPEKFEIISAVPTPFKQSTTVTYAVPDSRTAGPVNVNVYDCRGRCLRSWLTRDAAPGYHQFTWDGRDNRGNEVASGIYYCEIRWQDKRAARQLVLLR